MFIKIQVGRHPPFFKFCFAQVTIKNIGKTYHNQLVFISERSDNYYRRQRFLVIQDGRQSASLILFSSCFAKVITRNVCEQNMYKMVLICCRYDVNHKRYDPFNDPRWPLAAILNILISPNFKGRQTLDLISNLFDSLFEICNLKDSRNINVFDFKLVVQ